MGFHKFLIYIYLSSEFCNTWLYWSAMKRTSCSFGQRLIVQQKLGLLFEKMKPWSTNSSSVYYHSHKCCELVFLNSANKSVSGNFFSLFSSVNINKIQKNNKQICTHFFRHIVQSVSGRNKCLCCISHALCYGRVQSCATHNSFASCNGNVICACRANKADRQ